MAQNKKKATPKRAGPTTWPDVAMQAVVTLGKVGDKAMAAAPWVVGAICAVPISGNIAGKLTSMSVAVQGLDWLGGSTIGEVLPWLLAGASMLLGYRERRLRQQNIARLAPQKRELESQLDPNRTSSGLTEYGTTPDNTDEEQS